MSEYAFKYLSSRKRKIMELLTSFIVPRSARSLAAVSGLLEFSDWHRMVRREVAELIEMGYPIGSNQDGFYLIRTEKELQKTLNGLLRKQIALSRRIADLYEGFHS